MNFIGKCVLLDLFYIFKASAPMFNSGCSLVVRIPRCGRGDLGSNPSSHSEVFFLPYGFFPFVVNRNPAPTQPNIELKFVKARNLLQLAKDWSRRRMAAGDEKHSRKWRYTWEAQSHIPTLRLLLFAKNANPSSQCLNMKVQLLPSQSLVAVSWCDPALVSLRVPIPRVLIDFESPVSFRALDDHIEVKLLLLLPVDHPILSSFDSVMNPSDDPVNALPDVSKPLVMGSGNLNVLIWLFDNNQIRDCKVISRLKLIIRLQSFILFIS